MKKNWAIARNLDTQNPTLSPYRQYVSSVLWYVPLMNFVYKNINLKCQKQDDNKWLNQGYSKSLEMF